MATLSSRAADFWTQLKKPNISSYNRWHRHFRDQRDLFQRVAEQLAGAPFTDTTEQIDQGSVEACSQKKLHN